jgi:hypothetical protein
MIIRLGSEDFISKKVLNMNKLTEDFINPPCDYRPLPFWSWNDKLDKKELCRQLAELGSGGVGGYFMHSRGGIITSYLGGDWMDCIGTCVKEGNSRGLQSWIYDESGWPSGFAGGLVTALGDRYHARGLSCEIIGCKQAFDFGGGVLGVYESDAEFKKIKRMAETDINGADAGGKTILIRDTAGPYYIDVLSKEAVAAFIRFTHEKYFERFGSDFGKSIQGFFTDEPRLAQGKIPWSYILPEKFRESYGYDIVDNLPALFINCEGYQKIRYDFWQLVSKLFVDSFMKQIYEWCESHNCRLTGHVMMEESLYSQMTGTSGSMPFYEYMSMPGMDWLRRMIWNPVVPKQVSSAACQTGKKFVLTESYALCGWNVSFEELKWIAEWQFVNGVNRMCQHLFAYSLRGFRKRDYPPSHFFQEPWWKEYKLFNDYLARLSVLLTAGVGVVDVLVIHPMRSGWVAYDGENNDTLKKLDRDFQTLAGTLSSLHVDYHFGDETYIKKYGLLDGDRIRIGKCAYKVVVLPSMLTIDSFTAELLCGFANNGGTVAAFGDTPATCRGEASRFAKELDGKSVKICGDTSKLYEILKNAGAVSVSITQNGKQIGDISYQQRNIGCAKLVFMVNLSQREKYRAAINLSGFGKVSCLSVEKGTLTPIEAEKTESGTRFEMEFLPMQSHVILLGDTGALDIPAEPFRTFEKTAVKPKGSWKVARQDFNALTLDRCDCSVDGGAFENGIPVIKLFDRLLALKKSCALKMRFSFEADLDLDLNKNLFLILETPEKFKISVNGINVEYHDIGWWKDTSFKKIDIKPFVNNGRNEIMLQCEFYQSQKVYDVLFGKNVYETELNKLTYDTEIENIYLVGDFSVFSKSGYEESGRRTVFTDGPFLLRDMPLSVETGDLTRQGYTFFAGSVLLEQNVNVENSDGKRVLLDLGIPDAAVIKIFVNGNEISTIGWRPYTVDITDAVNEGKNKIGVQLFSGNRNLLGPHHHKNGEIYNVGPDSFKGIWSWCDRPTEAVEINHDDVGKNFWQDRYCFVRFGLD